MNEFESDRFIFSPVRPEDRAEVVELYQNEQVMRYIGKTCSDARANQLVDMMLASNEKRQGRYWCVSFKSDGLFAALVMLQIHPGSHAAEIGILVSPQFNNNGVATEAFNALIAHSSNAYGVKEFTTFFQAENKSVVRMLEKVGFTFVEKLNRAYNTTMVGTLRN